METVIVKSADKYELEPLKKAIKDIFTSLEIKLLPNQKILVKPNLLFSKSYDSPIITHPLVIHALLDYIVSCGAKPFIYEIPGMASVHQLIKSMGLDKILSELNIEIKDDGETILIENPNNKVVKKLALPKEIKECDMIINLAKLKTHSFTGLTLGVKNMFGLVKQKYRSNYHFIAGRNKNKFADIIIDIHIMARPTLTILDAIVGMEGNGPSSGTPHNFNFIAASKNSFALDAQVIKLVGQDPSNIPIQKRAIERNIYGAKLSDSEIIGEPALKAKKIKMPDSYLKPSGRLTNSMITLAYPFLNRIMDTRPKIDKQICISCYRCEKVCPARAINIVTKKPEINYSRCIRCFCCHEMCPADAIAIQKNKARKVMEAFINTRIN